MTTIEAAPIEGTSLELIEALDFDPPCEIDTYGITCGFPSTWFMVFREHCKGGEQVDAGTVSVFSCQEHYEAILNGASGVCTECHVVIPDLLTYLVRTERLKP